MVKVIMRVMIYILTFRTPEYSNRVRGKGKHYMHRQFFHSVANRTKKDFVKASKE